MSSSIPKPRTSSFGPAALGPTTITIPIDSRVVLTKRRSGWVRYIGKLKNEAGEWYGIALDEGKGDCDGSHAKERYFDCPANHGVFVRRKEIFCVKEYAVVRSKEPSSPVTHDESDAGSSTGSSAESQDIVQASHVASTLSTTNTSQTESMIAPLVRTFKSFRKELGLQISPTKSNSTSSDSKNTGGAGATGQLSPSKASPATGGRSSGLRSPSIPRFASFSSPKSTASRTASIVSQLIVASIGGSGDTGSTSPKSPAEAISTRSLHEDEAPQQKQRKLRSFSRQPSTASLDSDGDVGVISSLDDLYRVSLTDASDLSSSRSSPHDVEVTTRLSPTPPPAPPLATASTSPTRSLGSPTADKPVNSVSPTRPAPAPAPSQSPAQTSTRVTSFSSSSDNVTATGAAAEPNPAPLFFRRANIGSPTLSRRASFTNGGGGSSPTSFSSGKASPTQAAATARIAELEKEISVQRTNHENIVAVLRATNKQHAANVLELRAQVAALTEGNHWLEKQLAAKSALIAELHEMESSGSRVPRDEVEHIIAIKDAQIQTLEREIGKLKQHLVRIETEKDSILCQQARHARWRHESDEARIVKLREDVLAMCNERASLQCELSELKEMSFLF